MEYIEKVHWTIKRLIKYYDLKVGMKLLNINTSYIETIEHIHPNYGWVTTRTRSLKSDLSNLNEYLPIYDIEQVFTISY